MKTWYQNRMETGVTHRGQNILSGKKVYLTEAQAKLHNTKQEKVAKCDSPKDQKEVGVLADWDEWEKSKKNTSKTEGESQKSRVKSQK